MCGIVGFFDSKARLGHERMSHIAQAMADEIMPRGPNDEGTFVDVAAGLAFGFRRLAIVDLTETGHQPMVSASGDRVIIFNGEIYNADDLRLDLEAAGVRLRGHSDTEVLLEACVAWGLERTLERIQGMFAVALFDTRDRSLTLVRDRPGKKPVYYGTWNGCLIFGSQPRAFFRHPMFQPAISQAALSSYIRLGYVPNPSAIYAGMQQLPPGGVARIDRSGAIKVGRYWRAETEAAAAKARPVADERSAIEGLDALLRDSIKRRMVADVPLGAFLSGGIDSSLVVALMQAQSATPVKTFSIGFQEAHYNEAPYAAAVAQHLGTEHHELYVSPQDALDVVPRVAEDYDEPFADSSQIPTFLVSQLARQHVTVVLSGDGGDELFAGYGRYGRMLELEPFAQPPESVAAVARLGRHVLAHSGPVRSMLPPQLRARAERWLGRKGSSEIVSHEQQYRSLVCPGFEPDVILRDSRLQLAEFWSGGLAADFPGTVERCQMIDTLAYLPDDILVKVDRASMACSLEARAPLIDHRVFEFAWQLPMHMKVREGRQKWILRELLGRHVPTELFERPKMGFGVPIDIWLRGPLRDWAEDLLDVGRLRQEGIFDADLVHSYWQRHLAGENWHYALWCVLMFEAWKRRWMSAGALRQVA